MKIILPWPDKKLSPNARNHWAARHSAVKKARQDATYIAYDQFPMGLREIRAHFHGDQKLPVTIRFFPPDNRHRDADNMVASIKAGMDGIADALGVNDRRFRPTFQFCDPDKPGRVEVEL